MLKFKKFLRTFGLLHLDGVRGAIAQSDNEIRRMRKSDGWRKITSGALILSFFFVPTNLALSATSLFPKQLNYQAKLTDATNIAIPDGTYNMSFRLYTSAVSATTTNIWEETLTTTNRVTATNGLLSVLLGQVTSLASINFNQTLYLGVEIGGTTTSPVWDGEMTPRKQLGAVPAAFVADTLDGLDSAQFVQTNSTSTIASSSAQTLLTLNQSGAGNILDLIGSTGANFLSVLTGGNVGIGTTSPYAKLSVVGNVVASFFTATTTATSTFAGGLNVLALNQTGSASSTFANGIQLASGCFRDSSGACLTSSASGAQGGTGAIQFANGSAFAGDATNFFFDNTTKNLGVGTSSPYAKLSVAGQVVGEYFTATSTTATSTFANHISIASGKDYRIGGSPVISTDGIGGFVGFGNSYSSSGTAVGRSNSSTGAISAAVGYSNTASGFAASGIGGLNTASGFAASAIGYGNSATSTNSVALGYNNNSGGISSVAIGYINNAWATGAIAMGVGVTNTTANSLMIGPSDSAKLTILSSGNVGIGTTSPYAKLSVVGEIVGAYFTGTTTATSTFAGGLNVLALNQTGSASSTFANGIQLASGCFRDASGSCLTSSASGAQGGTGAVQFANGSAFAGDATNFFWDDTNNRLGLGTAVPSYVLSFSGSGNSTIGKERAPIGGNGNSVTLVAGGANGGGFADLLGGELILSSGISTGSGNSKISFLTATPGTSGVTDRTPDTKMTILGTGNVGIGTTSPYAKLSVVGEVVASFFTATTTATSTFAGGLNVLALNQTGSASSTFANGIQLASGCFRDASGTCLTSGASAAQGGTGAVQFANGSAFAGDATNFFFDNTTKNLGIGTSSPYAKLSVVGQTLSDSFNATSSVGYQLGGITLLTASSTLFNTFVGLGAGTSTTSGTNNTFTGYQSGQANTTGANNVANGSHALYSNTTGYLNTTNGSYSLLSNTTGFQNTANGYAALFSNTTGSNNTANGYYSIYSNTTGSGNTANGIQSLGSNTTGSYNTANGFNSLYFNTTGSYNTANGLQSLYSNTTGSYNTALGYRSGYNVTTGYDNIFLGHDQNTGGTAITTGYNNIGIGYNIKFPAVSSSNMLNLGNSIFANLVATTTSTTLPTDFSAVRFGIGTSSPWRTLSVNGNSDLGTSAISGYFNATTSTGYQQGGTTLLTASSTGFNTFLGLGAGTSTTSGGYNTFTGYQSGQANTTGYNNSTIGYKSLFSNTQGWSNVAIGNITLFTNTTGIENTAVGDDSMRYNTTGNYNTALGRQSLIFNTTGSQNTSVGWRSSENNTTGTSSTAVGYQAGYSNTTGANNTFLGFNAGYTDGVVTTDATLSNASALGYNAQVTASNSLILGGTGAFGVNVGIGTTSPYAKLSVVGQTLSDSFNATSSVGYQLGGTTLLTASSTGFNTFVGLGAGTSTTSGNYNTFTGYQAGQANTTGNTNTGNGYLVLRSNTTGQGNVANGGFSLYSNTTGAYNTADGESALYSNTTGSNNTATGRSSLAFNSTGSSNTASGYQSLAFNSTGSSNTASGYESLVLNFTGLGNTANGFQSLRNNSSGSFNTALGYQSGYNVTTGYDNIFLGHDQNTGGTAITTGYNNIGIGYNIKFPAVSSSNMLNLGNSIFANLVATTTSTTLPTDYSAVRFGLGTSSPWRTLSVNGNSDLGTSAISGYFNATTSTGYQLGGTTLLTASSTLFNTFVGLGAGTSITSGNSNTFVGYQSGQANTTGFSNTADGYQSLFSNTTGSYNSANGYRSLFSNTTGSYNTANGFSALSSNTTGSYNTALGRSALSLNTTGSENTAIGTYVLFFNTTGSLNTALGRSALQENTTGSLNTANGYGALLSNTTGSGNTANGYQTLALNTTGSFNTALGYKSGYNVTTGYDNIFLGHDENTGGTAITTGYNNIGLGYNIKFPAVSSSNMLNLGNSIFANLVATSTSTTLPTDYSAVRFGIGTSSPWRTLSVNGSSDLGTSALAGFFTGTTTATSTFAGPVEASEFNIATNSIDKWIRWNGEKFITASSTARNTFIGLSAGTSTASSATDNTALGYQSLQALTTGDYNTAVGSYSLFSNTTGYNNTANGYYSLYSNTTGNSSVAIGNNALLWNTTGSENIAVGPQSLTNNTTASWNTAIGVQSLLFNTTGSANTAFGNQSLRSNTIGASSTAIGYASGYSNTTGNFNTFLGFNAGYTDGTITTGATLSNATAIGYNAQVQQSNSLILGGTGAYGVNVGIGTTSPYAKLSVVGEIVGSFFTATSTTATSTLSGGLNVGNGGLSYDFSSGVTSIMSLNLGATNFDADAGILSWIDMPVTSASAIGTVESYSAQLDGNPLLTVYSESDGAGGIQNYGVGVGSTTPFSKFSISGTSGSARPLFTVASSTGENFLTVLPSGNIGIGTSSPFAKLSIADNSSVVAGSYVGLALSPNRPVSSGSYVGLLINPSYSNGVGAVANTDLLINRTENAIGTGAQRLIDLQVGGLSKFLVTNTGNVGIGTTSPYAKLSIVGSATSSAVIVLADPLGRTSLEIRAGTSTLNNTFIGVEAGRVNTTGSNNTANGSISLYSNTTGSNNTANGNASLYSNTTGYNNTANGLQSLYSNTTGFDNVANGSNALYFNTTGSSNTANGSDALYFNTTGFNNTANGYQSLVLNTTGSYNTANGYGSLSTNTTGSSSVALGYESLYQTDINGSSTAVGYRSGYTNTTGYNNTFLGLEADALSATLTNATAIGSFAKVGASNSLILGGTGAYGVNVGIGTTSPYAKLSVVGEIVGSYFTATSTTATSTFAHNVNISSNASYRIGGVPVFSYNSPTGSTNVGANTNTSSGSTVGNGNISSNNIASAFGVSNTASGFISSAFGYGNQATSTNSVAFGFANNAGGSNSTAIGYGNNAYADDSVALGNSITNNIANSLMIGPSDSAKLTILSSGNIGIGTTSPYAKLSVVGEIVGAYFTGTSTTASTFGGAINVNGTAASTFGGAITVSGTATSSFAGNVAINGNVAGGIHAGLHISYGGLCVDNDGACYASTTGRISALEYTTGATDLAENYFSTDTLAKGNIVMIAGTSTPAHITLGDKDNTERILGIVSTKPAIILGLENDFPLANQYPVALSGRVPVSVNLEHGPIRQGDRITISSTPGVGAKATATSSLTVGIALEDFTGVPNILDTMATGSVLAFVSLAHTALSSHISGSQFNLVSSTGTILPLFGSDESTNDIRYLADRPFNMNAQSLTNVKSLLSASGKWSLDEAGHLTVESVEARVVNVGEKLKVGSPTNRIGVTLYDETDGSPYCIKMVAGVLGSALGECGGEGSITTSGASSGGGSSSSSPTSSTPEPVTEPTSEETPVTDETTPPSSEGSSSPEEPIPTPDPTPELTPELTPEPALQ